MIEIICSQHCTTVYENPPKGRGRASAYFILFYWIGLGVGQSCLKEQRREETLGAREQPARNSEVATTEWRTWEPPSKNSEVERRGGAMGESFY